jgi:hypothetical protein
MFAGHYAAALRCQGRRTARTTVDADRGRAAGRYRLGRARHDGHRTRPRRPNALPGSALVLEHMPFTSLASRRRRLVARRRLARALRAASRLARRHRHRRPSCSRTGCSTFSSTAPTSNSTRKGPKLGFALWDLAVAEQAVEIGLIAITGIFWSAQRTRAGQPAWPAAAFIALLVAVQIIAMLMPAEAADSVAESGAMALPTYLVLAIVAIFIDGRNRPGRANSPQA